MPYRAYVIPRAHSIRTAFPVLAFIVGGCNPASSWDRALAEGCAGCAIEATTIWSARPGDPNITDPTRAIELEDGRVITAYWRAPPTFAPDGSSIGPLGGRGQGPGELTHVSGLAVLHDGRVLVAGVPRSNVFTSDLIFDAPFGVGVVISKRGIVPLDDGTIVLYQNHGPPGERQFQHVYTAGGEHLRSYDAVSRSAGQAAGPASRGHVWVAPYPDPGKTSRFHVARWDPQSGKLVQEHVREPPWFRDWTPPENPYEERPDKPAWPIQPHVYDVYEDASGVLWTITVVSDPHFEDYEFWKPPNKSVDTILEALDATTGELLAAVRYDAVITGFTNRGSAIVYEEDENGNPSLVLHRLELVGRTAPRNASNTVSR